jgi:hypothetical protein
MSSKNWGGVRSGAGRLKRNIHLEPNTARALSILTKQQRMLQPDITEEQIVARLIEDAWQELDAEYQQKAKEAG